MVAVQKAVEYRLLLVQTCESTVLTHMKRHLGSLVIAGTVPVAGWGEIILDA